MQATTAKVCLDLANSARFTVPVLSTADFNRSLLAFGTICRCTSRSKERSWPRNRGKSDECWINMVQTSHRTLLPEGLIIPCKLPQNGVAATLTNVASGCKSNVSGFHGPQRQHP